MDLALQLEKEMSLRVQTVDQAVEKYVAEISIPHAEAMLELRKAMLYSATNGGKRFRPVLALLVGELFGASAESILPFAIAVELIHTYSLIHDDLPCMDNDDIRRGKPTNHKVFGEDFALLAGDALLTEAFYILAHHYNDTPFLAATLIKLLSEAAGLRGMVGGQAIDLRAGQKRFTTEELTQLHLLKTGALIRVAAEGAALIAKAPSAQVQSLRKFGESLGLAFQVADDILDHGEKDQDARSFTGILGMEPTKDYLRNLNTEIRAHLHSVSADSALLEFLVDFNLEAQLLNMDDTAKNSKKRLDLWLTERGLASSRTHAQELIEAGQVILTKNNQKKELKKPSLPVDQDMDGFIIVEQGVANRYVSRGGLKLEGALAHLRLNVQGLKALDVGISTGGFTDCLLQHGVQSVVGVDVGHGQVHKSLTGHPRLQVFEGINARALSKEADVLRVKPPSGFDLAVMDVSFISITLIIPEISALLKPEGMLLSLVKPQFEVGIDGLSKGGIVKDVSKYADVERKIKDLCVAQSLQILDYFSSPILGKDGNNEFFIFAKKI